MADKLPRNNLETVYPRNLKSTVGRSSKYSRHVTYQRINFPLIEQAREIDRQAK